MHTANNIPVASRARRFIGIPLLDMLAVVFISSAVWAGGSLAGDPGLGWHIRTGQLINRTGVIPRSDPFIYSAGNATWVDNQWLAQSLGATVFDCGGWALLQLIVIFLSVGAFAILPACAWRARKLPLAAFAISVLVCAAAGSLQWITRPVIVSFLFTSFVLTLLELRANQRFPDRWFVLFPTLFMVWANVHPAFFIGLFCLTAAAFDSLRRSSSSGSSRTDALRWGGLIVACFLAVCVNPYGLQLPRTVFGLVSNSYFMRLNREWLPVDLAEPFFLPFTMLGAIYVVSLFFSARTFVRVNSALWIVVPLLLLILSLLHRRYIPFFALSALFPIAHALSNLRAPRRLQAVMGITCGWWFERVVPLPPISVMLATFLAVFALGTGHLPGRLPDAESIDQFWPKRALDELVGMHRFGVVFASPNLGGYIIFRGWPYLRPFIDDRNEVHGQERYEKYFTIANTRPGWREVFDEVQATAVIVPQGSALSDALIESEEWKLSVVDNAQTLFVRR